MPRPLSRRRALAGGALLAAWAALPRARALKAETAGLPALVQPRAAWDAALPGTGMIAHQIERVTLHHTGSPAYWGVPDAAAYLRAIQAFHTGPERRWSDIAYHLLIDLDGVVWEGRDRSYAGDSATAYNPAGHLLVAVLGDYDVQEPNSAQLEALRACVHWALTAYTLEPSTLATHRDYAATACPGASLYALLPELDPDAGG